MTVIRANRFFRPIFNKLEVKFYETSSYPLSLLRLSCHAAPGKRDSSDISAGTYLYACRRWPACDAYVTADRRTKQPLGTLANGDLRHKRILAHHALHSVQTQLGMSRDQSYRWLQTQMGLPGDQVHIAKCGDYRCEQIIRICENATAR